MTKQQILKILAQHDDLDAVSVAEGLGGTRAASSMLLLRLTRHGLIQRAFDPDVRVLFYSLTTKGRARLDYWTKIERKKR